LPARNYRRLYRQKDLIHFQVVVKETDLDIGIRQECFSPKLANWVLRLVRDCRTPLEEYIKKDPLFYETLSPYNPLPDAPPLVHKMALAAGKANVGPMAAVAGAIAEEVGQALLKRSKEVIVENGGDIFLRTTCRRQIGIFAGSSPFSYHLVLEITPEDTPLGICTSSGTVGHSLSIGKADAVVIISPSAALADAVATAAGNLVQNEVDLQKAVNFAASIPEVTGALAIKGDKLAAWGKVKIKPL